jgi:hypothetical protein
MLLRVCLAFPARCAPYLALSTADGSQGEHKAKSVAMEVSDDNSSSGGSGAAAEKQTIVLDASQHDAIVRTLLQALQSAESAAQAQTLCSLLCVARPQLMMR